MVGGSSVGDPPTFRLGYNGSMNERMITQDKDILPDARQDQGLYVLWLRIEEPVRARIGKLGELDFPSGLYTYVGSAQRNRAARVHRHLRLDKPKRWHIDYLRPYGHIVSITYHDGDRDAECQLVQELIATYGAKRLHPRFGASDCRCGGHLLWYPPETTPILEHLGHEP